MVIDGDQKDDFPQWEVNIKKKKKSFKSRKNSGQVSQVKNGNWNGGNLWSQSIFTK